MDNALPGAADTSTCPHISARLRAVTYLFTAINACTGISLATLTEQLSHNLREHPSVDLRDQLHTLLSDLHPCSSCNDAIVEAYTAGFNHAHTTVEDTITELSRSGVDAAHVGNELIVAESVRHLGLVHHEIRKLQPRLPDSFEQGDLLGYGWRGLRMALRQYDPHLGYKFSSFACPKINGAIRDGIRSEHHLPKRLTTFARKVDTAAATLAASLARTPTYDEIATWMDLSVEQRRYLPLLPAASSIDDDQHISDTITAADNPAVETELLLTRAALTEAISQLEPLPAAIVTDMYIHGHTLRHTATVYDLSQRAVRELRDDALEQLRSRLDHWNPALLSA